MTLWWLNLAGSSVGFTIGSLLLKRFADTGALLMLSLSFAVFAVSNLLFAQVLRGGLGQGVVASSMLQIVLMAILGVLVFGEKLSVLQVTGVALAAMSLYLILGPEALES